MGVCGLSLGLEGFSGGGDGFLYFILCMILTSVISLFFLLAVEPLAFNDHDGIMGRERYIVYRMAS